MADANNTRAVVYEAESSKPVAKIILNGYNIAAGGPLGKSGAMRSFKLIDGDLWEAWHLGKFLHVRAEDGRSGVIRIAAHPAEDGASGFVEFLA